LWVRTRPQGALNKLHVLVRCSLRSGLSGFRCGEARIGMVARAHSFRRRWQTEDGASSPDEREQVGVDPFLVRRRQAMRRTGIVDFLGALDELGRFLRRVLDRNDLVVLSVQNQSRDIELLEVVGKVGLGKRLDALVGILRAGLHAPEPELIESALRDLRSRSVGAVEGDGQILVVLGPVPRDARAGSLDWLAT